MSNINQEEASLVEEQKQVVNDEKREKKYGLYMRNVITRKVMLPMELIGNNLMQIIQNKLVNDLEGKCSVEAYIKSGSVRVINYSSGVVKGYNIIFDVLIDCLICNLTEGYKFKIIVSNVTKAGLRGKTKEEKSPVDVFVARDHNYNIVGFNDVKVGDEIIVRVLGQRYEINDLAISVIADLVPSSKMGKFIMKPKLVFE